MNQLVVFAHPNPNSFGKGIVDTIQKTSDSAGIPIRIRDLYQLGFDPILKSSDFETFQAGKVPEDIKTEQEHMNWADVVTFVYPVWWAGFPAILKGYVDRVFSYGFAYEYVNGIPNGLLKGRKALLFCTTGSPNEPYAASGMHNSMKQTSDDGIFKFSGLEVLDHVFYGAVPSAEPSTLAGYLDDVSRIIKEKL